MLIPHSELTFHIGIIGIVAFAILGCGTSEKPSPQHAAEGQPTSRADSSPASPTVSPPEQFVLEDGFRWLPLDQWKRFPENAECFSPEGSGLLSTGKPRALFYSSDKFGDFVLRFDLRYPRPSKLKDDAAFKGNTGLLVFVQDEMKLWPVSLEVQGKYAQLGTVKENGGAAAPVITDFEEVRLRQRPPVGEWASLEVTAESGTLTVRLGDEIVATSQATELTPGTRLESGALGFQAEDHPFEIRRVRIKP